MARKVDPEKIKNIEKSLMELIAEKGYQAVSIKMLSQKSNVSTGYLYRHYNNKEELVSEIADKSIAYFKDFLKKFIKNKDTVEEFVEEFVHWSLKLAKEDGVRAKFIMRLNIEKFFRKCTLKKVQEARKDVIEGFFNTLKRENINEELNSEDIINIIIFITMNFLFRTESLEYIDIDKEAKKISRVCLNAIKKGGK